ncbi:hypothetical protein [Nocardia testacea]|uniref:hypothetical protein n=1 Tax=Nocardia testacea TaxID=248551 RepID=UPI0033FB8159
MSRGPGTRQREILRRLQLVRCKHLPDLWHALRGHPDEPWPSPTYSGCYAGEFGQRLSLYGHGSSRSVRVAYRRAAMSLQASGRVEVRYLEVGALAKIFVRLPATEREKIAARGLRRRINAFRTSYRPVPYEDLVKLGEQNRELERERTWEYQKVLNYLWGIDRYPPGEETVPLQAARILQQGLSGFPAPSRGIRR